MSGLRELSISTLAKGVRGVSYEPNQLRDDIGEYDFYLLRSSNIQNGRINFENRQIVAGECVSDKQRLIKGDIIVCMSNGSRPLVGKSAIVESLDANYCVGAFCSSFRAIEGVNPNFVFQLFQSKNFKNSIDVILSGSAINNLQNTQIEELKFILPSSKREQNHIAHILSKADAAIAQTEELIAKYQRIKTGLMQDLLTKGIDEDGNIRSEKTHSFKESELGRIPVEWNCAPVSKMCELIVDCKNRTCPFVEKSDYAVIRTSNIRNGRLIYEDLLYTDEKSYRIWTERAIPQFEDIIITREAPLGEVLKVPQNLKLCLGQRTMLFRVDKKYLNPDFLVYFVLFEKTQKYLQSIASGSTVKHMRVEEMKNILIVIPGIEEQKRIISMLNSTELLLNRLSTEKLKLQSLKIGLMQDLLSGKVRVKLSEQIPKTSYAHL